MKKISLVLIILGLSFSLASYAHGQVGLYVGFQAGYSAQKPSLEGIEFTTDTAFLLGVRTGIRFLMVAIEAGYFQAAHNLEVEEFVTFEWAERQIDYSFVGINLKYFFSIPLINPFITVGFGYYTADIHNIDKDNEGGYNFGGGLELMLGKKLSLMAEAKYHNVSLDIENRDFKLGDFTLSGSINIYF